MNISRIATGSANKNAPLQTLTFELSLVGLLCSNVADTYLHEDA
jgi:hypothetical protein